MLVSTDNDTDVIKTHYENLVLFLVDEKRRDETNQKHLARRTSKSSLIKTELK